VKHLLAAAGLALALGACNAGGAGAPQQDEVVPRLEALGLHAVRPRRQSGNISEGEAVYQGATVRYMFDAATGDLRTWQVEPARP
jgi:hypothetical protein